MARRGVPDALEVALQHLNRGGQPLFGHQQQQERLAVSHQDCSVRDDGVDPQLLLGTATARAFHRVSRRCRAIACSTRSHAALDGYLRRKERPISSSGHSSYQRLEDTDPALIPWDFPAAAQTLSEVTLELRQVPALLVGPPGLLQDLKGRLRALKVFGLGGGRQAQIQGLGRLLAQSTRLQVLHAEGYVLDSEHLENALVDAINSNSSSSSALDPNDQLTDHNLQLSSSSSQGVAVAAAVEGRSSSSSILGRGSQAQQPLLELSLCGLPLAPFAAWLQRRRQAGQLRSLALVEQGSDFLVSARQLTSLTGLRQLRLEPEVRIEVGLGPGPGAPSLPESLTALSSSLLQLSVKGLALRASSQQVLGALTQLRRLQLARCKVRGEVSAAWLTALRRLTHLDFNGTDLGPLPRQLGRALPCLEVLELAGCCLSALPKGLTRLTRLHAPGNADEMFNLDVAALREATGLRELDLSGRDIVEATFLQPLTRLQVLRLAEAGGRELPAYTGEEVEMEEEEEGGWSGEEEEGEEDMEEEEEEQRVPRMHRMQQQQHAYWSNQEEENQQQQQSNGAWLEEDEDEEGGSSEEEQDDSSSSEDGHSRAVRITSSNVLLPPLLPRLVHLRHLDLSDGRWWVKDLVALGGLQHLTYLNLSAALASRAGDLDAGSLPALGVLPALRQLSLERVKIEGHDWPAVGAWLGQQPQLTRLSLQFTKVRDPMVDLMRLQGLRYDSRVEAAQQAEGLALLPAQLVELDLTYSGLQQLPRHLSQLTGLKVLLVGHGNPGLPPRLPHWLPALQQLHTLQVQRIKGPEALELLARLPQLRWLGVGNSEPEEYTGGVTPGFKRQLAQRLPQVDLHLGPHDTVSLFPQCEDDEDY